MTEHAASVEIANGVLTVNRLATNREGRTTYEWEVHIDGRLVESGNDLSTGVGMDHGPKQMLTTLCSFLSACAESYSYWMRTDERGENWGLFSKPVREWAYENSDELSIVGITEEETR